MHDAAAVRGVDGIEDLPREHQGVIELDRARERLPVDVLHDQVVRPDVIERTDMRMVQAGDRVRLALEAFAEGRQHFLDGDDAVEPGVASLVDLAHAAGADRHDDFVGTEPGARRQGH